MRPLTVCRFVERRRKVRFPRKLKKQMKREGCYEAVLFKARFRPRFAVLAEDLRAGLVRVGERALVLQRAFEALGRSISALKQPVESTNE